MKKLTKNLIFTLTLCLILIADLGATTFAAGGTGPYRRVLSKVGTKSQPYSYMETSVYLPTSSNVYEKKGTNDTAYICIGGPGNGTEIDAGLQHSPTYGNWAPFINCKRVYSHPSDTSDYISYPNKTKVSVSYTDAGTETVSINLK